MKIFLYLITIWSVLGMVYMWNRIGQELEVEAMVDPSEFHTAWHYVLYGPFWWILCLLFRILLFLLWIISS